MKQSRFKSPVVWLAILLQIVNIIALFWPDMSEPIKIIGTVIIQSLAIFGVLNDPTNPNGF